MMNYSVKHVLLYDPSSVLKFMQSLFQTSKFLFDEHESKHHSSGILGRYIWKTLTKVWWFLNDRESHEVKQQQGLSQFNTEALYAEKWLS